MLVYNPAKVLAAVIVLLVIYTNPITLLIPAVIIPIYYYMRKST